MPDASWRNEEIARRPRREADGEAAINGGEGSTAPLRLHPVLDVLRTRVGSRDQVCRAVVVRKVVQ